MVNVTAAVIGREGRVLLCRRPQGKRCAGLWEFPGGKVEPGETLAACLVRECREELGVSLRVGRAIAAVERDGLRITFLLARLDGEEPQLREHSEMAWVTPAEARAYALCPSDAQMLRETNLGALLCEEETAAHVKDEPEGTP